jgi:hypothetical protein
MMLPEATGPLSSMRNVGADLTGDESALRFMCHSCIRVRRITKAVIFAAFAILILIVMVLDRLHRI